MAHIDLKLATPPEDSVLMGMAPANSPHYAKHRKLWAAEVYDKLMELGFPAELWPESLAKQDALIFSCKLFGSVVSTINLDVPMQPGEYTGPAYKPSIIKEAEKILDSRECGFYFFTMCEDWWPYDKHFLVDNLDSLVMWKLYNLAKLDQSVLAYKEKGKRGRPRNESAHAARRERSDRYKQWLADCETYRNKVAQLRNEWSALAEQAEAKRMEWRDLVDAGAPKLVN